MQTLSADLGRRLRLTAVAVCCLFLVCGVWRDVPLAADPTLVYDVTPRTLDRVAPGTVIGNGPPAGWSILLAKVHSRPGTGDLDQISDQIAELASFLFSALVVNVEADPSSTPPRYRLDRLAVGIGTALRGGDTIISSATQEKLGADLDLLHRMGLGRAENRLLQVRAVARSEAFVLFDSPTHVVQDGRHQKGIIRHALLVDPRTGALTSLFWFIALDDQGRYRAAADAFEWMPANQIDRCVLHIDAREFRLGLITEEAIALDRLPVGKKRFPMPEALRPLAHRERFTAETARAMEVGLRELLRVSGP